MIDIQRHRGPNDHGMRLFSLSKGRSEEVKRASSPPDALFEGGLGFNRLSILDLSEAGHQPMANRDGSVILAFNGEIYNAFDFVPELEAAGFRFRSRTDTEVILYLYEHHGLRGMLDRLNGMFAIVIVDLNRRELLIARDHLGIKPFYWAIQDQTLLFASEIKSFLEHPSFRASLNEDHLAELLTFRYCAGERHLLQGVFQLRPGHLLRAAEGKVAVTRYWHIPDVVDKPPVAFDQAMHRLEELLRASVKSQLLSDVKVGCQLSGGIDSSLVTVFARTHFGADMDTFSIVFDDPRYSEETWISEAARRSASDSHRYLLTPETFFQSFELGSWHLDQPLNHPNSLGLYLLSERARKLVTVLLSGEGADELFGGYPRFYSAALLPKARPFLPLLSRLPRYGKDLARSFGVGGRDDVERFILSSQFMSHEQVSTLRGKANQVEVLDQRRALFEEGRADPLSNCMKYEMQTFMVDLLVRQDKMTMAHSMENRVPFLDRALVDFVRALPVEHLIQNRIHFDSPRTRNTKILLKRLAAKVFDERFVYRKKLGFSLPLEEFYQHPAFRSFMEDRILPGLRKRQLVNAKVVEGWWKMIPNLPPRLDEVIFVAIAVELWAQQFLDGQRPQRRAL